MPRQVELRSFPIETMMTDRKILIVGRTGTGKSYLLEDILAHVYKNFDIGLAVSPTPASRAMLAKYIPDSLIYDEYDQDKIDQIVHDIGVFNENGQYPRLFIILDDCMFDAPGILKSKVMKEIHYNGRHKNIWFVNLTQYIIDVPKNLRAQIDYIFCLKENSMRNRQSLWENFFTCFDNFSDFCSALDVCTENKGCLVMDQTSKSQQLEDCVFWYQAQKHDTPVMMGNRDLWKLHWSLNKAKTVSLDSIPTIPAFSQNNIGGEIAPTGGATEKVKEIEKQTKKSSSKRKSKKNDEDHMVVIKCPKTTIEKPTASGTTLKSKGGKIPEFKLPKITIISNKSPGYSNGPPETPSLPSAIAHAKALTQKLLKSQFPTPQHPV